MGVVLGGGEGARGNLILYEEEKTIEKVDCKLFGKGIIRSVFRQIDSISILFFFRIHRSLEIVRSMDSVAGASGFIRPCKNDYPRGMKRGVSTSTGPVPRGIGPELQKHRSNF